MPNASITCGVSDASAASSVNIWFATSNSPKRVSRIAVW